MRRAALLAPLAACLAACAVVDKPLLALRGVAGGIHNRRKVSSLRPFFLPDGRMGVAANGALLLEEVPGGELRLLAPQTGEADDPHASADGTRLVFVAGGEQVTAGGGHDDHVFQVYAIDLPSELPADFGGEPFDPAWRRLTRSRRAEVLPRLRSSRDAVVFVRRAEYEPYELVEGPWGDGSLFEVALDGSGEKRLTEPLGYPFHGLALTPDDHRAVFGLAREGGACELWTVPLEPGARPERLAADACLPAFLPDGRLAFARGDDVWVGPADGPEGAEPLGVGRGRLVDLAAAPDGRIAFTVHVDGPGRYGTHELWEHRLESGATRRLHRLEGRSTRRFKPLDVVRPLGWWFRGDAASPGSR